MIRKIKRLFARVKDDIKYDNIPSMDMENPKTTESNEATAPTFIGYSTPIKTLMKRIPDNSISIRSSLIGDLKNTISKCNPSDMYHYIVETGLLVFEYDTNDIFENTGSIFNYISSPYENDDGVIKYVYSVSMKSILNNIKYIYDNIERFYFLFNWMKVYVPDEFIETYMATMPSTTKEELTHLSSLISGVEDGSYNLSPETSGIYFAALDKDDHIIAFDFTKSNYCTVPFDSIMVSLVMRPDYYDILDLHTNGDISTYPTLCIGDNEFIIVQVPVSILYDYRKEINKMNTDDNNVFNLDILLRYIGFTLL